MLTIIINGVTYETDDKALIDTAKHCGPGFSRRIAERHGKIWRKANKA